MEHKVFLLSQYELLLHKPDVCFPQTGKRVPLPLHFKCYCFYCSRIRICLFWIPCLQPVTTRQWEEKEGKERSFARPFFSCITRPRRLIVTTVYQVLLQQLRQLKRKRQEKYRRHEKGAFSHSLFYCNKETLHSVAAGVGITG